MLTSLVLVLYVVALVFDCGQAASYRAEYESESNYYDRRYYYGSTSCVPSAGFEITTIILLISLVATTARSAYLLRQIEQPMPEVAVLPPGKMVTQTDQLVPFAVVPHTTDTENDEKSASTDGTIVLATSV